METQTERETLLKVAGLIDSAILRIERITRSIRGENMDRLEQAGIKADVSSLQQSWAALDAGFRSSMLFISDQWPQIQSNRARLSELHTFSDTFDRFCTTVGAFDNLAIEYEEATRSVLGEYEASREYAILIGRYAEPLQKAFAYEHSQLQPKRPAVTPLQGICDEMQSYFTGKTDSDLEDALLRNIFAGPRGYWNGTLTQATYFGKHFRVKAEVMNRIFTFANEKHQPAKAHYTRYPDEHIKPTDDIARILSKYPRKREKK